MHGVFPRETTLGIAMVMMIYNMVLLDGACLPCRKDYILANTGAAHFQFRLSVLGLCDGYPFLVMCWNYVQIGWTWKYLNI